MASGTGNRFSRRRGVIPDGTSHPDVLRIAAESGRVLVSRDVTPFRAIFIDSSSKTHLLAGYSFRQGGGPEP